MMLVLSLFPGGGLLDYAFEAEGFCVVRGPDPLWGGDIRRFHPPPGRFDGIIGGDPCQSHSALANLVRAKGLEPSFPDMTPEYQRVVEEARPAWFLRENVPQAPDIKPAGYTVRSFMLDNSTLDSGDGTGNEQMRRRQFWFGVREGECPELRQWMDFALFELPEKREAVSGGHDSGEGSDLTHWRNRKRAKQQSVTGRHHSNELRTTKVRGEGWVGQQPRRDLGEMLRLQGLPEDWLDYQPWTMGAKRKIVGNGVAVPMGRQLARAIRLWIEGD